MIFLPSPFRRPLPLSDSGFTRFFAFAFLPPEILKYDPITPIILFVKDLNPPCACASN